MDNLGSTVSCPSMIDATEPWLCCFGKHESEPYSVLVTPCTTSSIAIEGHLILDTAKWLCEITCLRNNRCKRKWLACRLCQVKFPGKATLSGRKRKTEESARHETVRSMIDHAQSSEHRSNLSNISRDNEVNLDSSSGGDHFYAPTRDTDNNDSSFHDEVSGQQPSPCPVAASTDQSIEQTSQILHATINVNSSLGNFISKENSETFSAARHIVSMACEEGARHGDAWKVTYPNPAPIFGTEYMFAYTQIFNELSEKSRRKFVRLIDIAMDTPPSERQGPKFGRAKVPSNYTDAKRVCLKGKHSIANSLPLPRFQTVGAAKQEHACAHPLDVIQYAFATLPARTLANIPVVTDNVDCIPAVTDSVSSYFESKDYSEEVASTVESLKTLGVTATIQIMVRWFSDAWDPNSTKDNRNGVWSMIMTVMFGPNSELKEVVFPLAVGPKAGDHSPAVDWVLNEISKLGDFAVIRDVPNRRNVRIRVSTALVQVDRLERGELWAGLNHSSNRGKCHGVIAGYDSISHSAYAPCMNCLKNLVSAILDTSNDSLVLPPCSECACYDPTSPLLTGSVPANVRKCIFPFPPSSTPDDTDSGSTQDGLFDVVVPGSSSSPPLGRPVACRDAALPQAATEAPTHYGPIEVNQLYMVVSCRFLAFHTWTGTIKTIKFVKAWAEVCGVSSSIMLSIYQEACRHRALETPNFSSVFTKELLPPTWLHSSWSIDKFLHAPMHLLFLGLTQKLVDMLDEWLAFHTLKASFNKSSSASCDSVGKLHLDWLKLLRYGHSTLSRGLWVSEQYVAFSKFMLVAVAGLVAAKNPMTDEIKCVLRAFDALFVLLSLLMRRSVNKSIISRSRLAIRMYLFSIDDFGALLHVRSTSKTRSNESSDHDDRTSSTVQSNQQTTQDGTGTSNGEQNGSAGTYEASSTGVSLPSTRKKYQPVSLSNPNTASLIRMILSMLSHGPPCDQWDGNVGCEASIQTLKEFFNATCMVDGDSVVSSFRRYYRNRLLHELGESLDGCGSLFSDDDNCNMKRARFTDLVQYACRDDVVRIFEGTEVIAEGDDKCSGAVSCYLYENDIQNQVVCVAIGQRGTQASLYQVDLLDDIKSVFEIFADPQRCRDRAFSKDFLYFTQVRLRSECFDPAATGYKLLSPACLVSASRHVWRDSSKCQPLPTPNNLKGLFTVVTHDYRRMDSHGMLPETLSPCTSLWKEVLDEENEWTPVDWEAVIHDTSSNVAALTVAELKDILRAHRQPLGGVKADLVARVQDLYETLAELPDVQQAAPTV